jgi:hypothetical protein
MQKHTPALEWIRVQQPHHKKLGALDEDDATQEHRGLESRAQKERISQSMHGFFEQSFSIP